MLEFEKCLDRTEPVVWEVIKEKMRAELGRPLEEVFLSVDPVPLASASVAQVHAAGVRRALILACCPSFIEYIWTLSKSMQAFEVHVTFHSAADVEEAYPAYDPLQISLQQMGAMMPAMQHVHIATLWCSLLCCRSYCLCLCSVEGQQEGGGGEGAEARSGGHSGHRPGFPVPGIARVRVHQPRSFAHVPCGNHWRHPQLHA